MVTAFCLGPCYAQVEIPSPVEVILSNGKSAVRGTCAVCGTKLVRLT